MIYLVELQARPGRGHEVLSVLRTLAQATAAEPGAVCYLFQSKADDPDRVVLYERYQTAQDAEQHMQSSHVRAALAAFESLLAAPPVLSVLDQPGGFTKAIAPQPAAAGH